MDYTVSDNNIHIVDSYMISKREFEPRLLVIKSLYPSCNVWQRKMSSLKREWATHNLLYALHIYRSRTKDVDLNYPCKYEWLYNIVGAIAWIFIK